MRLARENMNRSRSLFCFLLLLCVVLPLTSQENHQSEPGTGVLLARSTFAHGYRHGYEEGFHQGNIDINMTRPARTRFSELRGVPLGYQPDFGPRNSFLYGFQFGLMAGYADGYSGKEFRAISNLRLAATGLGDQSAQTHTLSAGFDRGVIFGYENGFGRNPDRNNPVKKDLMKSEDAARPAPSCQSLAQNRSHSGVETKEYCDGYHSGLTLGHADAQAVGKGHVLLEASK